VLNNEDMVKLNIVVAMGGCSSERDISMRSGMSVVGALNRLPLKVSAWELISEDPAVVTEQLQQLKPDIVFNALHGRFGEDGQFQSILHAQNVSVTGCDVEASHRTMNKILTQRALNAAGLPVPNFVALHSSYSVDEILATVNKGPWVIKPALEGSSVGIQIVHDANQLSPAIEQTLRRGPEVIVEQYIDGRELTVSVLDGEALAVVEILPQQPFYDYKAKYEANTTRYTVPALLTESETRAVQTVALKATSVMNCEPLARVDFLFKNEQEYYILEINTVPGLTQSSLLPKAAAAAGMDMTQLCLKILETAYAKTQKESGCFPVY
jgi:D-alanine-D-alanine ligase